MSRQKTELNVKNTDERERTKKDAFFEAFELKGKEMRLPESKFRVITRPMLMPHIMN